MSLASAVAAEFGEKKRLEWVSKIEVALAEKNWDKLKTVLEEMKKFYFSE